MTGCPTFPPLAPHLSNFPCVPLGHRDFWDSDQVLLSELGDVGNVDKVVDSLPLPRGWETETWGPEHWTVGPRGPDSSLCRAPPPAPCPTTPWCCHQFHQHLRLVEVVEVHVSSEPVCRFSWLRLTAGSEALVHVFIFCIFYASHRRSDLM